MKSCFYFLLERRRHNKYGDSARFNFFYIYTQCHKLYVVTLVFVYFCARKTEKKFNFFPVFISTSTLIINPGCRLNYIIVLLFIVRKVLIFT